MFLLSCKTSIVLPFINELIVETIKFVFIIDELHIYNMNEVYNFRKYVAKLQMREVLTESSMTFTITQVYQTATHYVFCGLHNTKELLFTVNILKIFKRTFLFPY